MLASLHLPDVREASKSDKIDMMICKERIMKTRIAVMLAFFVVAVLLTAGTCGGGVSDDGGAGARVDRPVSPPVKPELPTDVQPNGGEVEIVLPDVVEPEIQVDAAEMEALWPADLPDYSKNEKWHLSECFKSEDEKHLKMVFFVDDTPAHDVFRIHEVELAAKGYENRHVEDAGYFGREDYTNGEILVVVGVLYDTDEEKNRVEISVHMK